MPCILMVALQNDEVTVKIRGRGWVVGIVIAILEVFDNVSWT
jgi:hypothetical protein